MPRSPGAETPYFLSVLWASTRLCGSSPDPYSAISGPHSHYYHIVWVIYEFLVMLRPLSSMCLKADWMHTRPGPMRRSHIWRWFQLVQKLVIVLLPGTSMCRCICTVGSL